MIENTASISVRLEIPAQKYWLRQWRYLKVTNR